MGAITPLGNSVKEFWENIVAGKSSAGPITKFDASKFKTRFVMDVLCEEDGPLFLSVLEGLRLLEDDALGGGGSRGSGRVSFGNLKLVWRGKNYYATGAAEKEIGAAATLAAIQSAVNETAFAFTREE